MLSFEDARRGSATAGAHATRIQQPMIAAVVDAFGHPVAHVRMDGACMQAAGAGAP